jgi:predicted acylesterase/phospholipase RssA
VEELALPKPIQIAIQGGGAKIFSLLAAMQVVQEYEEAGKIEVTRLAGTSAGAFAACVYGARIDLAAFREELRGGLAEKLVSSFTPPGPVGYGRLLFGTPFWKSKQLRSELNNIFARHMKKQAPQIKDLKPEVMVTYTQLNSRRRDVHGPENTIADALLDSSGIPFCFRTWKAPGANIVDGGISENLPVEILAQTTKAHHGQLVAISFEPQLTEEPGNLREFAIALLDTAIDASVANARLRLGAASVLQLPVPSGTFEFEKALTQGLDDKYDIAMYKAKEFLDLLLDPNATGIGDPWSDQNIESLLSLGEMFNTQHKPSKMRYRKQRVEVTANSVKDPKQPDIIRYSAEFDVLGDPIYCHAIALPTADHMPYIKKSTWRLYNPHEKEMRIVHVPMKDPEDPQVRCLLLFFIPALPANTGPYTFYATDSVLDGMAPLREPAHQDEVVFVPTRVAGKIAKVEFVVHLPDEYKTASLSNQGGEVWGQRVDGPEVARNQPPGFRSLGWEAFDIEPQALALDVKLNI